MDFTGPSQHLRSRRHGLSLVELLLVITIIGFISSLGIATFAGRYREVAEKSRLRSTARNMVMLYTTGRAMGADVLVPGDLTATLHRVVDGFAITDGVASGRTMALPHVSDQDIVSAQEFIDFQGGEMVFLGGL